MPGLIPGAAEGKGLGLRFLRHLERTRFLVHLLDLDPATGRDPVDDWRTIQAELRAYSPELAARPQLIAANKTDLEGAGAPPEARRGLRAAPRAARVPDRGADGPRASTRSARPSGPRSSRRRPTARRDARHDARAGVRRVVVKVGSGLIADPVEGPDPARIEPLAAEVAAA